MTINLMNIIYWKNILNVLCKSALLIEIERVVHQTSNNQLFYPFVKLRFNNCCF